MYTKFQVYLTSVSKVEIPFLWHIFYLHIYLDISKEFIRHVTHYDFKQSLMIEITVHLSLMIVIVLNYLDEFTFQTIFFLENY